MDYGKGTHVIGGDEVVGKEYTFKVESGRFYIDGLLEYDLSDSAPVFSNSGLIVGMTQTDGQLVYTDTNGLRGFVRYLCVDGKDFVPMSNNHGIKGLYCVQTGMFYPQEIVI
jgi:hypothetical protein